jgi:hypothetical protein
MGRSAVGGTDFLPLYAGARLAATGHVYDAGAVWKTEADTTGKYGPSLLFTRPPCFALFLWPLAQLPYTVAKAIWIAIQLAAVVAAVCLWPGSRKTAAVAACWSLPVIVCLADGADAPLLFLWLALWRRLESGNRPFAAGVALALCIAKFHLFLALPLLLIRHRRWAVVKGAAAGVSALLLLSFVGGGWRWPAEYLSVLTTPAIDPGRAAMPNIHGLVPPALEIPAVLATLILTLMAIYKWDYADGIVVALTAGLLCSYHAYVADGVIVIPAIILLFERYRSQWPAYVAGFFMTPIPWVLVLRHGM